MRSNSTVIHSELLRTAISNYVYVVYRGTQLTCKEAMRPTECLFFMIFQKAIYFFFWRKRELPLPVLKTITKH